VSTENPHNSPQAEASPEVGVGYRSHRNWKDYSPKYNGVFWTALVLQLFLAVLTALILDFGQTHRAFWIAFVSQWSIAWMILFRRQLDQTRIDLTIVRFGIVPVLVIVAGLGPWFLRSIGIQP
jgi:hypothetical protein